ncbi:MAG: hypothetical protein IKH19_05520, partial [Muribaculaceae bacterium]|nr:hypothetical protein [Muribaculaceae bacterium]
FFAGAAFSRLRMQRYNLFPNRQNFSALFFKKNAFSRFFSPDGAEKRPGTGENGAKTTGNGGFSKKSQHSSPGTPPPRGADAERDAKPTRTHQPAHRPHHGKAADHVPTGKQHIYII